VWGILNLKKDKVQLDLILKMVLLMVNGKIYKIGVNVHLFVEVENNIYKEFAFLHNLVENHVPEKIY
jgi:hypothetical protein